MNTIRNALHELDLSRCENGKEQRTMHDSFDTISTVCSSVDDYGEEDVSLQSYGIDESSGSSSACSALTALEVTRNKNAANRHHELLQTRMSQFFESGSGKPQQLCGSTRRGSWNTLAVKSEGHKIEFSTRGETASVFRVSTVVHKVKKQWHIANKHGNMKKQRPAPYSLMTKMMKHNAILKRSASKDSHNGGSALVVGNEHITAAHNGSFFFSANVNVSVLSRQDTFDSIIDDFMSKTNAIEKDLAKATQGLGSTSAKLRRRKRLLAAYHRTMA